MLPTSQPRRSQLGWPLTLVGLGLFTFAVAALSGPGRIDITDGQVRYEVARSLAIHGDSIIRDPRVWFGVYPGRERQLYTTYRFPQSLLGAGAIQVADATGPATEMRRHFFFVLTSALAFATLAPVYCLWFRGQGCSPTAAIAWALGGVFATPNWYYGTSTFDEILTCATVVPAIVVAYLGRGRLPWTAATCAGLLLGLAYNVKPPVAIFVLVVLAALYDARKGWKPQFACWAVVLAGLALGVAVSQGYQVAKFPPGNEAELAEMQKRYGDLWSQHAGTNLLVLTVSPGAGVFFYCPPVILGLCGLLIWYRTARAIVWATLAASIIFLAFIANLSFAAGDPAWGPRYLTPVCAVLWLFVAAAPLSRLLTTLLISAGCVVQVLGLSVDPHRLYLERGLPSLFGGDYPELYFEPLVAHLVNRPREIVEIMNAPAPTEYTPARLVEADAEPTFGFSVLNLIYQAEGGPNYPVFTTSTVGVLAAPLAPTALVGAVSFLPGRPSGPEASTETVGRDVIRRCAVLNTFRPWWSSYQTLAPENRPVPIGPTVGILGGILLVGASFVAAGGTSLRAASLEPAGEKEAKP